MPRVRVCLVRWVRLGRRRRQAARRGAAPHFLFLPCSLPLPLMSSALRPCLAAVAAEQLLPFLRSSLLLLLPTSRLPLLPPAASPCRSLCCSLARWHWHPPCSRSLLPGFGLLRGGETVGAWSAAPSRKRPLGCPLLPLAACCSLATVAWPLGCLLFAWCRCSLAGAW